MMRATWWHLGSLALALALAATLSGCARDASESLDMFTDGQSGQVDTAPVDTPVAPTRRAAPEDEIVPLPNPLGLLGLDLATSDCQIRNDPYDTCI